MAWIDPTAFLDTVAHRKGLSDGTKLPARLVEIATSALAAAKNEILTALVGRGYTAAQAATWMRGEEFERQIALFWVGEEGAAFFSESELLTLKNLDRRKELWDVAPILDADGNEIVLAAGAVNATATAGTLNVRTEFDAAVRRADWRRGRCPTDYRY